MPGTSSGFSFAVTVMGGCSALVECAELIGTATWPGGGVRPQPAIQVISGSPTDVQPVLQAVAERAAKICDAQFVDIILREGETIRGVAVFGDLGGPTGQPMPLDRSTVMGRSIIDRVPVQVEDLQQAQHEYPRGSELARKHGHHTTLAVPLLREGRALGSILVRRTEVKRFDDKHIALLRTFADQAAIAMENVRLFNETQDALAQQTASADVLRVISSSVADAGPVFDKILQSCERLFPATMFNLHLVNETGLLEVARIHVTAAAREQAGPDGPQVLAAFEAIIRSHYPRPVAGTHAELAFARGDLVEINDMLGDPAAPSNLRVFAERMGQSSSALIAPLMWEGRGIGVILAGRPPGRFHARECALLKTFADQAVIAIQNAKMFKETQEALEQQKASSDVLEVISHSIGDAAPVFEAILVRFEQLIADASGSSVTLIDDDGMIRVGHFRMAEAGRKLFPSVQQSAVIEQQMRESRPFALKGSATELAIRAGRSLTYLDMNDPSAPDDVRKFVQRVSGGRWSYALAVVPLLKDGVGLGSINVSREVNRAFSAKELALLEMFADQAVVALENARLFNATQRALERQTATAEILKVIAGSPSDVQPVFDAIAAASNRLIEGFSTAVFRFVEDTVHLVAFTPTNPQGDAALQRMFPAPLAATAFAQAIRQGGVVHIADTEGTANVWPQTRDVARLRGYRAMLYCPLVRDEVAIGMISVTRREPGPFAEHQIELLQTFADQAVIAIENTRLFNETKEALDQQTATAEVLGVISNSVADTAPVFDAIVRSCQRLFEGSNTIISLVDDDGMVHHEAAAAAAPFTVEQLLRSLNERGFPLPLDQTYQGYAIRKGEVVHYPDMLNGPKVPEAMRQQAREVGNFSMLIAPMLWEGRGVGTIHVTRLPPKPFDDKEASLLRTFANQAVIAIQNAKMHHRRHARDHPQRNTQPIHRSPR